MRLVGASGDKRARYVIVGEAPGEDEELRGVPFIGQSGRLLWRLFGQCGITRDQCYVTNCFKERPPNNDVDFFYQDKRNTKLKPEYEHYYHELIAELAETTANVIVALGGTPLSMLTGNYGITKWRGSIQESNVLPGRKVIATFHPAHLFNAWDNLPLVIADGRRIKGDSTFPELRLPVRYATVLKQKSQVLGLLKELAELEIFGSDIETTMPGNAAQPYNTLILSIGFSKNTEEGFCIPFVGPHGRIFSYAEEAAIWQAIGRLMHMPRPRKIFHNGSFDYGILGRAIGIRPVNVEDTIIMMRTAYAMLPKYLATCASLFTREPYWKDDSKAIKNVRDWGKFWEYNTKDCTVMQEVYEVLLQHLHQKDLYHVYKRDRALTYGPLCEMMMRGIAYDTTGLAQYRKDLVTKIETAKDQLNILAGHEINVNSPKQLCDFLYNQLGLPEQYKRGKHERKLTADDAAIAKLYLSYTKPELELIRKIKKMNTELSRYVDMEVDQITGRVHCQYKPEPYTGRLSSAASPWGAGTNFQNLPH